MKSIHVLVTSISKKVPLIKAVKDALHFFDSSKLFGADSDLNSIGQYFVDQFWHMPPLDKLNKNDILDYCKQNKINAIIPTRDGELLFWSKMKDFLLENGVHVMVSDTPSLKICLDKQLFCEFLTKHHFKTPETTSNISELQVNRFVVKEKTGAGSKGIGLNLTKEEAINHAKTLKEAVFQPYIKGPEYTVDLFLEKNGSLKGAIARERLLVVDGESQISKTINKPSLIDLCKKTALQLNLSGHILFQVIEEIQDQSYVIIECNPRFGGASTLSLKAGLDSFRWFFHEVLDEKLEEFKRSQNEIRLIRHAEDSFSS